MLQGIIDVDNARHALDKLRDINWLHRTSNENSGNEATKTTSEVVSNASNPV